jgi:enterochelin esterase family protein
MEATMPAVSPTGNPRLEGSSATLAWQGKQAPHLICDLYGWEDGPRPLRRVGRGAWEISLDLPEDAYLEYAFFDPASGKRYADPLNPHTVYNGVGSHNHWFYMPGARPTPLARQPAGGLRGRLTRHRVPAKHLTISAERTVILYHPPAAGPVPLIVVLDGPDYLARGRLAVIVDTLIAAGRIRPVALAMVQNGGRGRTVEYGQSEVTLVFLEERVLPLAERELPLAGSRPEPGVHGILGASMGGLMAVYAGLRMPHIFGKVLAQAGSFGRSETASTTAQMVSYFPRPDIRLWLSCGRMDFLLEDSRFLTGLLAQRGYDVAYAETGGGHNHTTWRDCVADGLVRLFGTEQTQPE